MATFQSSSQFAYFCTSKKFNPFIFLTFIDLLTHFIVMFLNVKTAVYSDAFDHGHVVLLALYIANF